SDGLIDALVVYQLDRISRDVKDFANIYSILEEKSVMFVSIKENIDTATPIGKAMMYVTMVFAQMERETIAARVTDNMIGLAKKGLWTGGNPPYGYRRERIEVNGKKHCTIVPVPEAAEYVRGIYEEFLEGGYSLQGMETEFKRQGRKTVNGAFFSTTQLHKILTMPYCAPATPEVWDYYSGLGCQMADERDSWDGKCGVMIYGRSTEKNKKHQIQPHTEWVVTEGVHEPFIDADLWLSVQERFRQNTFEKKKKYDIPLLKGTLRCAKCGGLMQVARKKLAHGKICSSYYCLKRMRQGPEVCDMSMIKCSRLDDKVLEIFSEIEADPSVIRKYSQVDEEKNDGSALRDLERKASVIRSRIGRLTESLADGSSASKYIIAQIENEDLSLAAVNREIEILKMEERRSVASARTSADRSAEICRMMKSLSGLSADEKNAIVREVVQECTWDGETLFLRL
ncbi:MAG: recombinase family protein, partial [Lachnospiraceae bacterium]|nr:recombinase family protein [Lachnospiraceae bacterium]